MSDIRPVREPAERSSLERVLQGRSIDHLPADVRDAVLVCRAYEEQGAAWETLLANWPRAEIRARGGVDAVREERS